EVGKVDVGVVAGAGAKLSALGPAALGVVLGAGGGIHAAIDRPVGGIAEDCALGGRASEARDKEAGLAAEALGREGREGKVEDGDVADTKAAAINLSVAADVDNDLVGVEGPPGAREFAGGDRTVLHDDMVGSGVIGDLTRESERGGGGQD